MFGFLKNQNAQHCPNLASFVSTATTANALFVVMLGFTWEVQKSELKEFS